MILGKDVARNIGITNICDSVSIAKPFDKICLLNIGNDFPKEFLTITINKVDEAKFLFSPSSMFIGNKIWVTG